MEMRRLRFTCSRKQLPRRLYERWLVSKKCIFGRAKRGRSRSLSPRGSSAWLRLTAAGAIPNTSLALVTELFRDWKSPLAGKAREVITWYLPEVQKLTAHRSAA